MYRLVCDDWLIACFRWLFMQRYTWVLMGPSCNTMIVPQYVQVSKWLLISLSGCFMQRFTWVLMWPDLLNLLKPDWKVLLHPSSPIVLFTICENIYTLMLLWLTRKKGKMVKIQAQICYSWTNYWHKGNAIMTIPASKWIRDLTGWDFLGLIVVETLNAMNQGYTKNMIQGWETGHVLRCSEFEQDEMLVVLVVPTYAIKKQS